MTHAAARAPWLRRLARYAGIIDRYLDQSGTEMRVTSDATRRAILHALGADAANERLARASLERLRAEDRAEMIAPVRVVERRDPARRLLQVARATRGPCAVEIASDDGITRRFTGRADARSRSGCDLRLPDLPIGYHRLSLACTHAGAEQRYTQMLIIVPARCTRPAEVLGADRAFGLVANLYSIRSAGNWGVGDFSDLAKLAAWSAGLGADFVGVNPLHALLDRGTDISPYSPASRLFRNPIYVDVAAVPELAYTGSLARELSDGPLRARIEAVREPHDVRYEQVMAMKHLALDALHRTFVDRAQNRPDDRARAYDAYVHAHGAALDRFATWMAIAETHGGDWRRWPAALRAADSRAVRTFAAEHVARIDYHRWVQFEADRQLGAAADAAASAGMRIGLYQDLAIGSAPGGADTWAHPGLFALDAGIGAPPDPYARDGQQWGLPPLIPRLLRAQAYEYFINVLRAGFRRAGALRIDHVMGLFRLFWIPGGLPAREGGYLRYPARDLLGILALESARHHALVVGEDLGTVPPEVPAALRQWGILSSKVLYFERTRRSGFKSSAAYPARALATANTHDLPTIEAFWRGADIDLRARVGLLSGDDAARAREARDAERRALLRRLVAENVLFTASMPASPAKRCGAMHAFLCRTPSRLVGLALDDLTGEVEPVNLPGVGPERFPSWTRRMRTPLETAMQSDEVRGALRCDGRAATARRSPRP